jgi:hypothetical protein
MLQSSSSYLRTYNEDSINLTDINRTFALCFWYAVKLYLHLEFASVEALVVWVGLWSHENVTY